ncbi:Rossmann-like and DUF2520 domain-containing protein [Negadavirga shengliensis]|uniref:Rossmann-like and DUF2520 domain-containing protein n=1 Tax=Negadavirga shengliensis TaxID=1389218 RepID=A0ABV9SUY7_9BACT
MKFKIAIIGTGKVAWHFSTSLENAGHIITEVYGRDLAKARRLTSQLYDTDAQDHLDFTESAAEIFIVAVADDAISEVADAVLLPENSILVHTSGTVPLEVLGYSSAEHTGVVYPLQSFSLHRTVTWEEVPILLEAEDPDTLSKLKKLVKTLSAQHYVVRSKDRNAVHVAAVFASNFTNHMIRIAEEIMLRQGLDFEMIKPLIIEQISKCLELGPKAAQTGPASREDMETLENHHLFLQYNDQLAEIYRLISQDIIDSQ